MVISRGSEILITADELYSAEAAPKAGFGRGTKLSLVVGSG